MSLFGLVTLGILTAMAVSPDCGCTDTCELAKKVRIPWAVQKTNRIGMEC
jgi:hypothetical protein